MRRLLFSFIAVGLFYNRRTCNSVHIFIVCYRITIVLPGKITAQKGADIVETIFQILNCQTGRGPFVGSRSVEYDFLADRQGYHLLFKLSFKQGMFKQYFLACLITIRAHQKSISAGKFLKCVSRRDSVN